MSQMEAMTEMPHCFRLTLTLVENFPKLSEIAAKLHDMISHFEGQNQKHLTLSWQGYKQTSQRPLQLD